MKQKLEELPNHTGIYKFYNSKGKILYVGKAINLKSRVGSYFTSDHLDRPWIAQMIPLIADIKTIKTENEVEALILEANLIKKYKPKYNADMKDDKTFIWILIDTHRPYPRIRKTRNLNLKGRYFGPYPDGRPINRMLKYLRKIYPYASCNLKFYPNRLPEQVKTTRKCLYYHLNQCTAPCDNLISSKEYKEDINQIVKTLQGKRKNHIKRLEKKMEKYSKNQEFEKAAILRDKISDLRYLSQRIDLGFGDTEQEFSKIREERFLAGLQEVVDKIGLNIPQHIVKRLRVETYDISNLAGQIAYGSMAVAKGPRIDSSQYRIFKIRDDNAKDDTAMMKKVIERRLKHLEEDTKQKEIQEKADPSLSERPLLIVLDGGKPQLSVISKIVPTGIRLIAISKGKHLKRAGQKQTDEFWYINSDGDIKRLRLQNPFIFQNLRDEAHRFAIKHHRKGRKFLQKKSILDSIEGVGPKRKKALMLKFKTISGIAKASTKDINKIVKNEKLSANIKSILGNQKPSQS